MYVETGAPAMLVTFPEQQHSGQEVEDMNASLGVLSSTGHYISKKRLHEQQECRSYWVAMYGHRAGIESRGGVNWLD